MDRIAAFIAFAVFCGFVGILAYKVASPDLVVIIVIATGLMAYDMLSSSKKKL